MAEPLESSLPPQILEKLRELNTELAEGELLRLARPVEFSRENYCLSFSLYVSLRPLSMVKVVGNLLLRVLYCALFVVSC